MNKKDFKDKKTSRTDKKKRAYVSQSDVPCLALEDTVRIAKSLWDDFAGKSAAPHQLAMSVEMSPTSKSWQILCGASIAYGLVEGGSKAENITLTHLGKQLVAPTKERDDLKARAEAIQCPRIVREFLQKYNKAKFPSDRIGRNVLTEMGVPQNRSDKVLEIIRRNGEYAGIIHLTTTGNFVALETPTVPKETTVNEEV